MSEEQEAIQNAKAEVEKWQSELDKEVKALEGSMLTTYRRPDVEMTFGDLSGVLHRFYKKGSNRYRLETVENVGRSIRQLVEETLRAGRTDNDGSEAEGVVE